MIQERCCFYLPYDARKAALKATVNSPLTKGRRDLSVYFSIYGVGLFDGSRELWCNSIDTLVLRKSGGAWRSQWELELRERVRSNDLPVSTMQLLSHPSSQPTFLQQTLVTLGSNRQEPDSTNNAFNINDIGQRSTGYTELWRASDQEVSAHNKGKLLMAGEPGESSPLNTVEGSTVKNAILVEAEEEGR